MRKAGILLPVFSLPGKYGIGSLSGNARKFIDFLKKSGQSYWQILPVGPTGYGDSPYQSFSTFAGNPYFIDLAQLTAQGLLSEEECGRADFGQDNSTVDYGKLYVARRDLLRRAFARADLSGNKDFEAFREKNRFWLSDYALFMALKDAHGGKKFTLWEEDLASFRPEAVSRARAGLEKETAFYEFLQYEFFREWKELKDYAGAAGISIIGDIPIYVSADSADFWAHRELFKLDERGRIAQVAGVPPDGFSADGQVWGNPLYDWEAHAKDGYAWWKRRIGKCLELYDVIRIDHFRGFDEYFAVPADEDTAKNGVWEKGPGAALFQEMEKSFGKLPIIAEDLGYMKDSVREMVKVCGYPNMKVLEFAFDSRDSSGAADYLPYNYNRNCVVYTGTHDNETARGWLDSILPEEYAAVKDYVGAATDDPQEIVDKMIRMGMSSVADTCIIPMQDYLGLDNSARINRPSTYGTNWKWRVSDEELTKELSFRILSLTRLYGRERDSFR